jgi:PAS domain-containing protein
VQKVARSRAVTDWFSDQADPAKRAAAYAEMMDYAGLLLSAELYFGIHESLDEYSIGGDASFEEFLPYSILDPDNEMDIWYFDAIASGHEYVFNIDIDKLQQEWRIWINHKVVADGQVVGVFCSGLQIDTLLQGMFARYDVSNTMGYVIDRDGVIQLDSTFRGHYEDMESQYICQSISDPGFARFIEGYLSRINGYFDTDRQPEVIRLTRGPYGYASVVPIAYSDWSVVTFFNSNSLFSAYSLIPLVLTLVSAFVLYILLSTTLTRHFVLLPLSRLSESVSLAEEGTADIYGVDRDDEIGELAGTILDAWSRLSANNHDLRQATLMRRRLEELLHTVNHSAALLLSTETDGSLETTLNKSMELIGLCLNVDRVQLWPNEVHDEALHFVLRHEWLSQFGKECTPVPHGVGIPYSSMPQWEEAFLTGGYVNGSFSSLSHAEQELLAPYDIKSIVIIPLFIHDHFWGFFSIDDCKRERVYTEEEIDILRSASLMMVSAVTRALQAAQISEALDRASLMLDATPLCCQLWDREYNVIACNEAAVKLYNLGDKQEYLDSFFNLSPDCQPDGRRSSEKAE